jgi:hypothetical protein
MTLSVRAIVAGDIKSPQKQSLQMKWYQAVRVAEEVKTLREKARMLLYTYTAYLSYSRPQ